MFEIVLYRLRYKLSLRNLTEMFLLGSFQFTHKAVPDWEARLARLWCRRCSLQKREDGVLVCR